jgi:hypothetical protein
MDKIKAGEQLAEPKLINNVKTLEVKKYAIIATNLSRCRRFICSFLSLKKGN